MYFAKNIKINQYENIELGNALFGHSRGNYPVERGHLEAIFVEWLESHGFDSYGHFENIDEQNVRSGFTNDTFEINPYYWGDEDCEIIKPNFLYKPENIELRWYKYPLRDAYSSVVITENKLIEILDICAKSLEAEDE